MSLNVRRSAQSAVKRIYERVRRDSFGDDVEELEHYQGELDRAYAKFNSQHDELIAASKDGSELDAHEELLIMVEEQYGQAARRIKRLLKEQADVSASTSMASVVGPGSQQGVRSVPGLKLKAVELPHFDGQECNWLQFRDQFEQRVHRVAEYDESFKLAQLMHCVDSSKVSMMNGVYTGGYESVWRQLKARYDRKRRLIHGHMGLLLQLRITPPESCAVLREIVDRFRNYLRAMALLGYPTDQWDAVLYPLLVTRLPVEAAAHFDRTEAGDEVPNIEDMLTAIENYAETVLTAHAAGGLLGKKPAARSHLASQPAGKLACFNCGGHHRLAGCAAFLRLGPGARIDVVNRKKICLNCFSPNHSQSDCQARNCRHCNQKHHSILCQRQSGASANNPATNQFQVPQTMPENSLQQPGPSSARSFYLRDGKTVLLGTAQARVQGRGGEWMECRILCDPGSQLSFIRAELADDLDLPRCGTAQPVEGISASTVWTNGSVAVRLLCKGTLETVKVDLHVMDNITGHLPTVPVDESQWEHLRNISLADPQFGRPGAIDILLGADHYGRILRAGDVIRGSERQPYAVSTCFGWVVFGQARAKDGGGARSLVCVQGCAEEINQLMQRFWELEEPGESALDPDQECERLFEATVTRSVDGRYSVRIPFRSDSQSLGHSYTSAMQQFHRMERRLMNSNETRAKYVQFMKEYVDLGHMERVQVAEQDVYPGYYIPHHAVMGKFRVVFNGSMKSSTGVALNDTQLVGGRVQDTLACILQRFRVGRVAVTADVEKMFRQIAVAQDHRKWQRILWRDDPADEVAVYELATITYGLASSPFLAARTLQQCALDNWQIIGDERRGRRAQTAILENFYVDDCLASADSVEDAVQLGRDIAEILAQGRFPLRKWNSSDARVVKAITGSETSAEDLALGQSISTVLGLHWDSVADEFYYRVDHLAPAEDLPTKRSVLSAVGRLYDPNGFLAPVVVSAKMFIQLLWMRKLTWDEVLPEDLAQQWREIRGAIGAVGDVRIPRWLGMGNRRRVSFHGFSDASQRAYAAVVFVRSVDEEGKVSVVLQAAKTKVAPVSGATIPRLELCGAQLLTKLMKEVRTSLHAEELEYTLYCDSTIVLAWIRNSPGQWKEFVSNRVRFIQENSCADAWRHVRTLENPADCASRGVSTHELLAHPLWWTGPAFLHEELSADRGNVMSEIDEDQMRCERRPARVLVASSASTLLMVRAPGGDIPLVDKYQSLTKLLHVTALLLRMTHRRREERGNIISASEADDAMCLHLRQAQEHYLGTELRQLVDQRPIHRRSPLLPLNPIVGSDGLMRVGGRLINANLPLGRRQPWIVPSASGLCRLIIAEAHAMTLHGGVQLMLQHIRRKYWIVNGRSLVKSFVHRCVTCRLHQRKMHQQQMAALPRSRVTVAPPFHRSGVDYCGPFSVRVGGPRSRVTTKCYGVVFVCMVTRAVHLELAVDLSTRAFLDCFDRFVLRRGPCRHLYCDNGTQFVGAEKVMRRETAAWRSAAACQRLADLGTEFHFITPAAPFHGGLWEAAVRSMKTHLRKVVGQQVLSHVELSTLLVRIEGCLNSRPIVGLTDDVDGGTALTPGEFLTGRPLNCRPEVYPEDTVAVNRLHRYQQLQSMHKQFWRRWEKEYLDHLQARGKWLRARPNVKVGDVVAVQDENLPPTQWRVGRVTATFPGPDGLVRTAAVSCNSGQLNERGLFGKVQLKRPIQKLCRLVSDDEESTA